MLFCHTETYSWDELVWFITFSILTKPCSIRLCFTVFLYSLIILFSYSLILNSLFCKRFAYEISFQSSFDILCFQTSLVLHWQISKNIKMRFKVGGKTRLFLHKDDSLIYIFIYLFLVCSKFHNKAFINFRTIQEK